MSLQLGINDLAKYPFLEEAGDIIKDLNLEIKDLGEDDYKIIVKRSHERVLEAVYAGKISEKYSDSYVELLSFHISIMVVKATGLETISKRFSHAESLRVERFLERENNIRIIVHIFRKLLNIELIEVSKKFGSQSFEYKIHFTEYLKRSVYFHSIEWKLVNRIVDKGYVYLITSDLVRLIREEIRIMIHNRINDAITPKLPIVLQKVVENIQITAKKMQPKAFDIISPKKYPPCVINAIDLLKKGENIPHYGRFLMTTYLLAVGKTVDDIVNLFPKSPDFNEQITKYQVEHIAGLKGGRTRYKTPSCITLKTHSFCFKIDECNEIKNPIQFGRQFGRKKNR